MADQRMLPILGMAAAGAVAFGAGVFFMSNNNKTPPAAPVAAAEKPPEPPKDPAAAPPKSEQPKSTPKVFVPDGPRLDPKIYDPKTNLPIPQNTVRGKWEKMSGYGLPNPRPLTRQEKEALDLLGGAIGVQGYKFSTVNLDDGSTIPAKPNPSGKEVDELVLGRIREKGLGAGFDQAIRAIAVRNPNYIRIKVAKEVSWSDVQKVLGVKEDVEGRKGTKLVWRDPATQKATQFEIVWTGTPGWLSFGVDSGKVRLIQAEWHGFLVQYPEFIAAEDVEGGRSDPDPSKAIKKAKVRPANAPPPVVEILQKLGTVADIKVVPYPGKKESAAMRKFATDFTGKPLYPDLVDATRSQYYGKREVRELLITPTGKMTQSDFLDIIGENRTFSDDTRTFPGLTVRWQRHQWIDFAMADAQLKKIRIHCMSMPKQIDK